MVKRLMAGRLMATAVTAGLVFGIQTSVSAAEKVVLKFGPFQQIVNVSDIDRYAATGEAPGSLRLFKPFLSDGLRRSLTARLNVDPSLGQQFATDMLKSPSGQKLLAILQPALPGLTPDLIQAGVGLAITQFNGLDAVGVLKAIPQDTITVDVSQAIGIASKVNWSYWRTQAMSTVLQDGLKVEAEPVALAFDPSMNGQFAVSKESMTRQDTKRDREITFDIYSPNTDVTGTPLVVVTPGYEADRRFLAYIANHLASHGFTVVAMQHPSVATAQGKINLDQLIPPTEFIDRPRDVSFVLDELTELGKTARWENKFNTNQVAMIGHSLGGYTALALAGAEMRLDQLREFCSQSNVLERVPADWLQCNATKLPNQRTYRLHDQRVAQVMALNPAIGKIFGDAGLSKVQTSSLIFSSSEDALAPALSQQFQPFTQLPDRPKYLFTAIGPTHLSISDPDNFSGALAESTLVQEKRGPEMDVLRKAMRGISLAFVSQLTPNAKKYAPVLTPGYVQSQSSEQVVLRFNQELPQNVTQLFQLTAQLQAKSRES